MISHRKYKHSRHGECLVDINNDGKLNVKDATLLQKGLAGLVEIPQVTFDFEDFRNYDVTDFNADGKLNIGDATAIQKNIANIENLFVYEMNGHL